MDGWTYGLAEKRMVGQTDGRTDGRTNKRTDGHELVQRCDGASKKKGREIERGNDKERQGKKRKRGNGERMKRY